MTNAHKALVTNTALAMRAEIRHTDLVGGGKETSAFHNLVGYFADTLLEGEGTEKTIVVDRDYDTETWEITHPDLPEWELQLIWQADRWAHPAELRLGGVLLAQKWGGDTEWTVGKYV
jgi:hypothetical protein